MQGDLEDALGRILRAPVETNVAGRTDAGVHALGQVVGCPDAPDGTDPARVREALNGLCGPAIAAASCSTAPEDWHARFSARSRLYVYAVLESEIPDPFLASTTYRRPYRLDVDAMNEAAGHLAGEQDFSSFGRVEPDGSPVRTLLELRAVRSGSIVRIRARATSFIQQMVRSLAGTLIDVGEGKRSPQEMTSVLKARDRSAAGPVAPPHGLCLVSVEYDEGWSHPIDVSGAPN